MYRKQILSSLTIAALTFLAPSARADLIPVGYMSWNVNIPGSAGEFDITNLSGPNALPPDFPVLSGVNLVSLTLTVDFVGGGSETFGSGSGYFSLAPDGLSLNGTDIPIGGTNPLPVSATLTGDFSPTSGINVSGMGAVSILPSLYNSGGTTGVSIVDSPNLEDGDFGVIYAETTSSNSVPEPGTLGLAGLGLVALLMAARTKKQ